MLIRKMIGSRKRPGDAWAPNERLPALPGVIINPTNSSYPQRIVGVYSSSAAHRHPSSFSLSWDITKFQFLQALTTRPLFTAFQPTMRYITDYTPHSTKLLPITESTSVRLVVLACWDLATPIPTWWFFTRNSWRIPGCSQCFNDQGDVGIEGGTWFGLGLLFRFE